VAMAEGSEAEIDEGLVVRLLEEQAPHLAGLPVRHVRNGWDNAIWRLGDGLAVRVTILAPRLPLPVPVPVIVGIPSDLFAWPWSVVPWFDGDVAAVGPPHPAEAPVLGAFLAALHVPAPEDVVPNPARGGALASRQAAATTWADQAPKQDERLVAEAMEVFHAGVVAPASTERVWIHGDVHARNVLVRQGRLRAVLDWGDVTAGDAAADLAALWWLFDLDVHGDFWSSYGRVSSATCSRARAWAALFGLSFLSFVLPDDPTTPDTAAHELGRQLLRRVVADPVSGAALATDPSDVQDDN
jgi:aminoglycoside phosphotransferase (APT) family kinase protein